MLSVNGIWFIGPTPNIQCYRLWKLVILFCKEQLTDMLKWATSWENLFLPYANNKGADQPTYPRSLISTFVVRCLDSMTPIVAISNFSTIQLASAAEQAGLSLNGSQTPKTGFLVTWLKSYWKVIKRKNEWKKERNHTSTKAITVFVWTKGGYYCTMHNICYHRFTEPFIVIFV